MNKISIFSKFIVLLILALTTLFVIEVIDIFVMTGKEPIALIGMVTAIVTGEFSLLYLIYTQRKRTEREEIRQTKGGSHDIL